MLSALNLIDILIRVNSIFSRQTCVLIIEVFFYIELKKKYIINTIDPT